MYISSPTDGSIKWVIKQAIKILFSPLTACVGVETISYKLQGVSQRIARGAGCCQLNYLDRVLSYRTHYSWLLPKAKINYWTEFAEANPVHCRSQWPRGLRRRSAAAHLLGLWVRIPPGAWMSVLSVVCCQVEVSSTGWSLVQRSPTDCDASLCVI